MENVFEHSPESSKLYSFFFLRFEHLKFAYAFDIRYFDTLSYPSGENWFQLSMKPIRICTLSNEKELPKIGSLCKELCGVKHKTYGMRWEPCRSSLNSAEFECFLKWHVFFYEQQFYIIMYWCHFTSFVDFGNNKNSLRPNAVAKANHFALTMTLEIET